MLSGCIHVPTPLGSEDEGLAKRRGDASVTAAEGCGCGCGCSVTVGIEKSGKAGELSLSVSDSLKKRLVCSKPH